MNRNLNFKVQILGEMATGKTSILNRFFNNDFDKSYITTMGITMYNKKIKLSNVNIGLKVFDTCGQERFHSVSLSNVRGCQGLIIVYDVTNNDSFEKVTTWISKLSNVVSLEECQLVLLGNKNDLKSVVDEENVKALIKKYENIKLDYFLTSAKNNTNINESFLCLLEKMLEAHEFDFNENELKENLISSNPQNNSEQMDQGSHGIILSSSVNKKKKKKCCSR